MKKNNNRNYWPDLSDKAWLISENEWDEKKQKEWETLFCIGNGYVCSRGILEEVPYDSTPGTYVAGVFDKTGAQITELVNLPNPFWFKFDMGGEKIGAVAMDIVNHERVLDMQKGILHRKTKYFSAHHQMVEYQSKRFISMHDPNVGFIEILVKPLDSDISLNVQTIIDTSVTNKGMLTEGRKRHFQTSELKVEKDGIHYHTVETFEKRIKIAYASILEITKKNRAKRVSDRALKIKIKKGEAVTFRKYFTIMTSREVNEKSLKGQSLKKLRKVLKAGITPLIKSHVKAWEKRWEDCDFRIKGDDHALHALRFNIYSLIIGGREKDYDASVGARTLSGEGYRGHVFWDAEIFAFPFYLYTMPKMAENMLLYRARRLGHALNNAKARGYDGSLYPWESADTGEECTPSWSKGYDGTIIRIYTHEQEHHIVADIAFALNQYHETTGDTKFHWKYGLEMMFASAQFWASRVKYNEKYKAYVIKRIIGPDEFHESVKNNVFTNELARWNLRRAAKWYMDAKKQRPKHLQKIAKSLNLKPKEVANWKKIADKIYISRKGKLLEQFSGYLRLKETPIIKLDNKFMPLLPPGVTWQNIGETKLLKQADVVMLFGLLPELYSLAEQKYNYKYYERRTMHRSSLSASVHALVGARLGFGNRALHYFAHALSTDLGNTAGNLDDGIHAANCGGVWQAAFFGFAGVSFSDNKMNLDPKLPAHCKEFSFRLWWQGCQFQIVLTDDDVVVHAKSGRMKRKLLVSAFGKTEPLSRKTVTIRREK